MADRLEVQFSQIVQRGTKGCTVTVRLYRLGDAVVTPEGTTYPRVLLRTETVTLGPVQPFQRFVELLRDRAASLMAQFGWNLPEIVCDL